jgi:hypothetical protein
MKMQDLDRASESQLQQEVAKRTLKATHDLLMKGAGAGLLNLDVKDHQGRYYMERLGAKAGKQHPAMSL